MIYQQYVDFDTFSRSIIVSKDVDPIYPLLQSTLKRFDFEPEWFILCYSTHYSLESAMIMCKEMPSFEHWNSNRYQEMRINGIISKHGHERRASQRIISNQILMFDAFVNLKKSLIHNAQKLNQIKFCKFISNTFPFHGVWSSYKISELFEKSLGYSNLSINDLGIDGKDPNSNDGPISGLRWLFGRDEVYDKGWYSIWNDFGLRLSKEWGVDIGEVESSLCKFHKLMTGKYWNGHDITEMCELKQAWGKHYEPVMKENFDPIFWKDINHFPKQNKKVYKDTGKLLNSGFAKELPKIDVIKVMQETLD